MGEKRIVTRLGFGCVITFITSGVSSATQLDLPPDPQSPTLNDCRVLSAGYGQVLKDLYGELMRCMARKPQFGYAPACGGGTRYTAWISCATIQTMACDVEARRTSAEKLCLERAEGRSKQMGAEQQKEEQQQLLANRLKKANDVVERAFEIPAIIADPKKYFLKALGANSPLLKQLFSSSDYASDSVKPDLASELYRYAQGFASRSTETTSSPGIRAIQKELLTRIGHFHTQLLSQADNLSTLMNDYVVSNLPARNRRATFTPGSMHVKSQDTSTDKECAVFADENTSRELQRLDPGRWQELASKCYH